MSEVTPADLPAEVDLVVVGSGSAGLSAALAAGVAGAEVLVLEASPRWGGTTALSGSQPWVPGNHRMADLDVDDIVEDALTYWASRPPVTPRWSRCSCGPHRPWPASWRTTAR